MTDFDGVSMPYADYLSRVRQIESAGDNSAVSSTGAKGPFQFTSRTWKAFGNGGNPFSVTDSTAAAQRLAVSNAQSLQSALGRPPTNAELYVAHQQGAGGAAALLSNPTARAGDLVGDKAIKVNGGDPNAPAADFVNLWTNKYNGVKPSAVAGGSTVDPNDPTNNIDPAAQAAWGSILGNGQNQQQALQQNAQVAKPVQQQQKLDVNGTPMGALASGATMALGGQGGSNAPLLSRLLFGNNAPSLTGMVNKAVPTPNNGQGLLGGMFGSTPNAASPSVAPAAVANTSGFAPSGGLVSQAATPANPVAAIPAALSTPSAAGGGSSLGGGLGNLSNLFGGLTGSGGSGMMGALGSGISSGLSGLGGLFSAL